MDDGPDRVTHSPAKSIVSIVLPTHNRANLLPEAVSSCLKQNYGKIELILVDDHSTDATPRILAELEDERVRVIRNRTNLGIARSLNVGFRCASGDYLTWTSDDNLYHPNALFEMVSYLETHSEVGLVYADYWNIDEDGNVGGRVKLDQPASLRKYNCVNACFLYRRRVYETVGEYDPGASLAEDYDYWLRVEREFKIAKLDKPLYYYRHHPASLTSSAGYLAQHRALENVKRRWVGEDPYIFPSRLNRGLARVHIEEAFHAHRTGNWLVRRRHLLQAIYYDPRWLKNWGVLSLLGRSFIRWLNGSESKGRSRDRESL